MGAREDLVAVKRKISSRLMSETGVSGVGIRGDRVVVYLETDDPRVRKKSETIAGEVAPGAKLLFDVAGRFGKP